MKRLIPSVVIVFGVLALAAVIAYRVTSTQASDDPSAQGPGPSSSLAVPQEKTQSEDVAPLKGNSQSTEAERKIPFVGIALSLLPESELNERGIEGGVLVQRVLDDSPADGKLEDGDVITAINGEDVSRPKEVIEKVRSAQPGDVMTFSVVRGDDTLDVDVTLGEREVVVHEFRREFSIPGDLPFGRFGGMTDRLVKAEVRLETDDGVKTFRAAVGTVENVDVGAGTFDLKLKDGSETLSYRINGDTRVVIRHTGDLSGLNSEDEILVVEVEDDDGERTVNLVAQGEMLEGHRGFRGFGGSGFRLHDFRDSLPHRFFQRDFSLGEDFHRFLAPEGIEGRLFDLEKLLDELPDDIKERLEGKSFGPGRIEIEKEIIIGDTSF